VTQPEDWARVNELFHLALDRPAPDREAFLRDRCECDDRLLREVLSLLAAHDAAEGFIEPPTLAGLTADSRPALVGRTVGPYRIDRVLGEGGMGIVYLADDTRLARPVALKALPARYTQDAASRERLKREARAAASLSHPGIATVYALEEFDGDVFVAFEFVPGETLRAELRRGPLPVRAVVPTALALARALAAAHERGIVHRDLKPENVMRTPTGDIKILDFGLARFREPSAPDVTLTSVGSLMGTPAHMSPEQIRAGTVDSRSDVFSLGVLVYELASGANPFAGVDHAATIGNVLDADPPPLRPPAAGREADRRLFDALERVIGRCLQRQPGARFQSAHEIVRALEAIDADTGPIGPRRAGGPDEDPAHGPDEAGAARWWWQFHQVAASVTYLALLVPLWWVREWTPGIWALAVFLTGLVSGLVASLLRWHLWFAIRSYPGQWRVQRRAVRAPIAVADATFAAVLLVGALLVLGDHSRVATVLVAAAVAVVVAFTVIEPATTRAAFDA